MRLDALDEEIDGHQQERGRAGRRRSRSARERMPEINQQREALQAKVREREQAIEAGRQADSAAAGRGLHAEEPAGADRRVPGRNRARDRRASTREEQTAAAEIERLEAARKQLSETMAQRQLELETVTGERRRTEEELAERRRTAAELRREIDAREDRSLADPRAQGIAGAGAGAPHLHHRIGEAAVRRRSKRARRTDLKPLGVLADYVEVDPQFEKPAEEFLHEELEYVVVESWQQAERGLDFIRAELDGRATFLVHPGAERQRPRPPAGAGHRAGNRDRGAAERFAAPHQRLHGPRHRPAAARLAVLPGGGPRRGAAPGGGLSAPLFPAARRRSAITATP